MDLTTTDMLYNFEGAWHHTTEDHVSYIWRDIVAAILEVADYTTADGTDIEEYEKNVPASLFYNYLVDWKTLDRAAVEKRFPGLKITDEWLIHTIRNWRMRLDSSGKLNSENLRGFANHVQFWACESTIGLPDGIALHDGWRKHVELMEASKERHFDTTDTDLLMKIYRNFTMNGKEIPMPAGYGRIAKHDEQVKSYTDQIAALTEKADCLRQQLRIQGEANAKRNLEISKLKVKNDMLTNNIHTLEAQIADLKKAPCTTHAAELAPAQENCVEDYISQLLDKIEVWYGKSCPITIIANKTTDNGVSYTVQVLSSRDMSGKKALTPQLGTSLIKPLSSAFDEVVNLIESDVSTRLKNENKSIDEQIAALLKQKEENEKALSSNNK